MKETVTDRKEAFIYRLTQMLGKYQFLAESCDSPTKRKAYEEFYNFLSALLEFAQETWQSEGGQSHDVKA